MITIQKTYAFTLTLTVIACASAFIFVPAASADCSRSGGPVVVSECGSAWDRAEISAGFIFASRSYSNLGFETEGASSPQAAFLLEPFGDDPFASAPAFGGLRFEGRTVISHVRMTLGMDFGFPSFPGEITTHDVLGTPTTVLVRSIRPRDVRMGLGLELPIGPVGLYADLIGAVHSVNASLVVDMVPVEYSSVSFGFIGRAGARLQLREYFFVTASGELGLIGTALWGAELSVGATIF